ncbi:MAG: hypothetical protein HGA87_03935 [Desulfobulbaceae bacterium]|nr:hypothetical protein [Desulfobulbaceae bacterium]
MNQQYELTVRLTVKGPVISSGGGDGARGLNRVFSLNAENQTIFRGSHVKGKLREALRELSAVLPDKNYDLHVLFGKEQEKEDSDPRHPKRASVRVSDFTLAEDPGSSRIGRNTRVSIDRRTGTSREQHLQMLEKRFESGSSKTWIGTISFFSPDENAAKALGKQLEIGLKWITALGGTKGTGYGRLEKVVTEITSCQPSAAVSLDGEGAVFPLCFEFVDDLLIGGQKKPKSNFVESEKIIPGSAVKGSLARFLNQICGVTPDTLSIDQSNSAVAAAGAFPLLAKYFSRLRFLHAFPVPPGQTARPVVLPYSAVQANSADGELPFCDIALLEGPVLDIKNRAPRFLIDWKESDESVEKLQKSFGWGSCEIINKTRTAIEEKTRTAEEEKLYTFQYLTPYQLTGCGEPTGEKKRVRWISRLILPQLELDEKQLLLQELNRAIHHGWRYMGKRDARFRLVDIGKETAISRVASRKRTLSQGDLAVILLQTDTLMFDAKALAARKSKVDLQNVYKEYWNKVTGGSCELLRFFARQHMSGGYLAKKLYPLYSGCYYPYVLTEAGSVFVLEVQCPDANTVLNNFIENGLPLPPQITALFPEGKAPWDYWKKCPFVPENGYGEIIVNLDWHWENCLSSPAAGEAS